MEPLKSGPLILRSADSRVAYTASGSAAESGSTVSWPDLRASPSNSAVALRLSPVCLRLIGLYPRFGGGTDIGPCHCLGLQPQPLLLVVDLLMDRERQTPGQWRAPDLALARRGGTRRRRPTVLVYLEERPGLRARSAQVPNHQSAHGVTMWGKPRSQQSAMTGRIQSERAFRA